MNAELSQVVRRAAALLMAGALSIAILGATAAPGSVPGTGSRASEKEAQRGVSARRDSAGKTNKTLENGLGMKFVPVPDTSVLFSVWETRVQDFEAFVRATEHKPEAGMFSHEAGEWRAEKTWKNPGFTQTKKHPVCGVSWNDATAFCAWLTERERATGRIRPTQSYRLPSDAEWSAAVGLKAERGTTPESKQMKVKGVYPWGRKFPPPSGAGNYAGSEARTGWPPQWTMMAGYRDKFPRTAPVGSFAANEHGIHDLGGNVWEWCGDWWNARKSARVFRGGAWFYGAPDGMLSSYRGGYTPGLRNDSGGFRCVLVMESSR